MKIGGIPIAAITLLLVALGKYIVKNLFAGYYLVAAPYFDGALMGVLFVYLVYYANIYITAWVRNRKEGVAD